ncbi:MAG: class I tRNA ligase family protein, partial [bacterium]|nr:class I tRNA ligase family protein [bacterium]
EGLKTTEAREKVLEWLGKENLLEKEQDITNNLSVCYRCGRELEPQPSKQWFLKMEELIKPAISAVETNQITFTPTRWKRVYLDWMNNIRDWCISRQIWWGHKIPIEGETDVLDTWFSSALWPFAVFLKSHSDPPIGGEESAANAASAIRRRSFANAQDDKLKTIKQTLGKDLFSDDLKYFYPTTILSTARDINMLWVVRMIFSGYEFMDKKPFSDVYVHPTVFNIKGKRMSKSLATGVDPLELIDKYGADATRFGLAYINTGTQDIKFDENAILAGKKFANKIWNISRFVMMQYESVIASEAKQSNRSPRPDGARDDTPRPKTEADKKILADLVNLVISVNLDLDNFRFGQAAHELYDFVWHD